MESFQKTYGISIVARNPVTLPDLSLQEQVIEKAIFNLLEIIEHHFEIWRTSSSVTTINALIESKNCVITLLTAIQYDISS